MPTGRGSSAREGIFLASDRLAPLPRPYSGRPPGRTVTLTLTLTRSRRTLGCGQVMPRARGLLGVLWAARLAISHRASLPRRRLGAAPRAVATPRVAPGPAHAGSQVAPAQGDAFRAASAGMALRLCLQTDRPRAFGRSSPTAPRHPRSTLSAPPGHLPVSCVHPSHPSNPTHRSRTRLPPTHTVFTPHGHLTPHRPCVRRRSEVPFDLDQGRVWRAKVALWRLPGPGGPGGCSGARGVGVVHA